jgi:hypothetical protein
MAEQEIDDRNEIVGDPARPRDAAGLVDPREVLQRILDLLGDVRHVIEQFGGPNPPRVITSSVLARKASLMAGWLMPAKKCAASIPALWQISVNTSSLEIS